ncbi:tRNA-specific adenosine deaminase 2 [Blumeria hordei DH14]|uniref:tRNA-specific adenosine deaminase 2 n=1 Tax=Blumeria graminis f. sp. hordei (strain DH14) TaxID=546991 RepID=N1JAY6_BLUG1|nr:tRNA-specific adenosine deaminase 2 [Blumeria hordei DH14]
MGEAVTMAQLALENSETPVGCVLVYQEQVIGRGMNDTNRSFNGTRHAEFMAINQVLTQAQLSNENANCMNGSKLEANHIEGNGNVNDQILNKRKYSPEILSQCTLYVTVEPCIMCASLLRQVGIQRVFFGAWNDKFGGTGSVLHIHKRNGAVTKEIEIGMDRNYDFEVSGGWMREEAILLLRRFYVQENNRAPEPRDKGKRVINLVVEKIETVECSIERPPNLSS